MIPSERARTSSSLIRAFEIVIVVSDSIFQRVCLAANVAVRDAASDHTGTVILAPTSRPRAGRARYTERIPA